MKMGLEETVAISGGGFGRGKLGGYVYDSLHMINIEQFL